MLPQFRKNYTFFAFERWQVFHAFSCELRFFCVFHFFHSKGKSTSLFGHFQPLHFFGVFPSFYMYTCKMFYKSALRYIFPTGQSTLRIFLQLKKCFFNFKNFLPLVAVFNLVSVVDSFQPFCGQFLEFGS